MGVALLRRDSSADRAFRRAQRLDRHGRLDAAIDALSGTGLALEPRHERYLVDLRHRAFFAHRAVSTHMTWPPEHGDSQFAQGCFPEIDRPQLNADAMWSGVFGSGCLVVRDLLPQAEVETLRMCISNAYESHDRYTRTGEILDDDPWFFPFQPCPQNSVADELNRGWYRESGAELAADSPRSLLTVIDILRRNDVIRHIADYLGERPALSVRKTSLRRIPKDIDAEHGWHQDGAFLGKGIRTVNLWIALTDCGIDAPSMDMVPRRLHHIVPSGTEGAVFEWSVSALAVAEAAGDTPPQRMHFRAGDAVFFDEMNLHRTGADPGMTNDRFALEAWFFAPSCYPMDQMPILV